MKTDIEFEAKFYPVDKEIIRKKLLDIGANLIQSERLMRRQIFNKELNPEILCDYIRIRDEGDKTTMSAKTHAREDGSVSDQKEVVIDISDFDSAIEILKRAGLTPGDYQENKRETWELEGTEIVIDSWPSLETYIEIEANSEELVRSTAEKLGCDWNKKIITSVIEIYASKYALSREEAHQKIRYCTFEKPPF